ncbi:MAG: hypothetical protein Q7U57_15690 [Methylovulum sp.]|nr:hypothetical protein [Methylovulum sp.]
MKTGNAYRHTKRRACRARLFRYRTADGAHSAPYGVKGLNNDLWKNLQRFLTQMGVMLEGLFFSKLLNVLKKTAVFLEEGQRHYLIANQMMFGAKQLQPHTITLCRNRLAMKPIATDYNSCYIKIAFYSAYRLFIPIKQAVTWCGNGGRFTWPPLRSVYQLAYTVNL